MSACEYKMLIFWLQEKKHVSAFHQNTKPHHAK